jgi:cell wall-associated NlpC family hydrolase
MVMAGFRRRVRPHGFIGRPYGFKARGAAVALAALAAAVGLLASGSDGMPIFRLAGNPGPGKAVLNRAGNLVTERAAALSRAQAHVTVVATALARLQAQAEVATEAYDRAVGGEQQAAAAYQAAEARLAIARATASAARRRIAEQAAADFETQGGLGPLAVMFGGAGGPGAYINALGVEQLLASHRTDAFAASKADAVVASVFSQQASVLLAQKRADLAEVSALKRAAQAAVDHQVAAMTAARSARGQAAALLAIARASDAHLEAEHRAAVLAQERAAAAQQAAELDASDTPAAAPAWTDGSGATAEQGNIAASWALSQIGKPYQWGAAGPDTYDCSGLAMDAWARAGIRLGHWTGWQWPSGPHIPIGDLRRGDLVFFATNTADANTIHHVGIYIGGDMMVDAPYTGAFVRIDSIYGFTGLFGATRPAG